MELSEKNWLSLINIILDPKEPEDKKWSSFVLVLASFDWHYDYSDDPQVWLRGKNNYLIMKDALRELEKLDKRKANTLFKEYERKAYESLP